MSNNPAEPQASPLPGNSGVEAGRVSPVATLDPRSPIEVAPTGDGTVNDPSGRDNKPPTASDLDHLFI